VVSYTVTSSGGQQVTAAVPNDWAIIDGLTDGTSYTFMVKANTQRRRLQRGPAHLRDVGRLAGGGTRAPYIGYVVGPVV
jgi:hypothetical protein